MTKRDIKETFSLGDISVGDIEVTGHGWVGHCQRDIFVVIPLDLEKAMFNLETATCDPKTANMDPLTATLNLKTSTLE